MTPLLDAEGVNAITGQWSHADLPKNVRVGANCFLERRAGFRKFLSVRDPGLVIGNRVKVYTWAEFNTEAGGYIEIGDDSVLVGPIFMCGESIVIGRRVIVSYNVTIADSDFHPLDPEERKLDAIANAPSGDRSRRPALVTRPVVIEDDVWIGIGAIILKGVRIGRNARIGAGAVITKDVPPGATANGNPAQIVLPNTIS